MLSTHGACKQAQAVAKYYLVEQSILVQHSTTGQVLLEPHAYPSLIYDPPQPAEVLGLHGGPLPLRVHGWKPN